MRYAEDPMLVREILLREITHALLGSREGDPHGKEFRVKLWEIGRRLIHGAKSANPVVSGNSICIDLQGITDRTAV